MARAALMVLVVSAMVLTGEVVSQSTCNLSIGYCTVGNYFTQGSSCTNGTSTPVAPVSLNFTTLGALLTGASATSLGLSATLASSLSTSLVSLGSILTGSASIQLVPLASFLG